MILGQLVAISVASNLFYLALSLSKTRPQDSTRHGFATPTLWLSILASLLTVALSPFTSTKTFLPNLLAMHALIVIPLLSPQPAQDRPTRFSISIKSLYTLIAVISLVLRLRTTAIALLSLPGPSRTVQGFVSSAIDILHSHPAQSSIGWDVIWTSISFAVWMGIKPSREGVRSRTSPRRPRLRSWRRPSRSSPWRRPGSCAKEQRRNRSRSRRSRNRSSTSRCPLFFFPCMRVLR